MARREPPKDIFDELNRIFFSSSNTRKFQDVMSDPIHDLTKMGLDQFNDMIHIFMKSEGNVEELRDLLFLNMGERITDPAKIMMTLLKMRKEREGL